MLVADSRQLLAVHLLAALAQRYSAEQGVGIDRERDLEVDRAVVRKMTDVLDDTEVETARVLDPVPGLSQYLESNLLGSPVSLLWVH